MKELTNAGRRQMLISTGSIAAMAGLAGVARADLGKPDLAPAARPPSLCPPTLAGKMPTA